LLEKIREPLQEVHDAFDDRGRIGFWAWMILLRVAEFAMTVSTDDHQFVAKLASWNVVEFQAAWIILATNDTSRRIGSEAFKPRLTPAFLF